MRRSNGFARETDFTAAALAEMKKLPRVMAWRNNTGRRGKVSFGAKGSPDIIGIVGVHGRFFGCETKQPGEELTQEQHAWARRAIEHGALIWVATTLEEALRPLIEIAGKYE